MKKILLTVLACVLCLAVFSGCQPKITVENALEIYDQAIAEIKQEQSAFCTDVQFSYSTDMMGMNVNMNMSGQLQMLKNEDGEIDRFFVTLGGEDDSLYEITYIDNKLYLNMAGTKLCASLDSDEMKDYIDSAKEEIKQAIPDESKDIYIIDSVEELEEQKQSQLNMTINSDVLIDLMQFAEEASEETADPAAPTAEPIPEDAIREGIALKETVIFTEENKISSIQLKLDVNESFFEEAYQVDEGMEAGTDFTQLLPSKMSVDITFTNITTTVDIQAPEDADEYYSLDDAGDDIFGDDMFGDVTGLPAVVA